MGAVTIRKKNFHNAAYRLRDRLMAPHKVRVGTGINSNPHSLTTASTISNSSSAASNSSASPRVHAPMRWVQRGSDRIGAFQCFL